jgi:alpha-L-fucosidase
VLVQPDAAGNVELLPDTGEMHGGLKAENQGGQPNIGFWDNPEDYVSWKVDFKQAGRFKVTALCATINAQSEFVVEVAGQKLAGTVQRTGTWADFKPVEAGTIEVKKAGKQEVAVRPKDAASWKAINLQKVTFTRQ